MSTRHRRAARLVQRGLVVATAVIAAAGLVVSCSAPSSSKNTTSTANPGSNATGTGGGSAPAAALGDTLNLGTIGSTHDSIYPYVHDESVSEGAMWDNEFDNLTELEPDGSVSMALAQSMTPSDGDKVWTVKLRPGVEKHNGGTLDADDLIWSIKTMLAKKTVFQAAANMSFVDPNGLKKIDDMTVQFTLKEPYGPFPQAMSYEPFKIMGADSTPAKPDGTGPFTMTSFTPGREAILTKFDGYWGKKPGFTTLHMYFFNDQTAVVNALLGKQIDVATTIPYANAKTLKDAGINLLISDSAQHITLDMRSDIAPFNNADVRRAMMLIVDREQVVQNAYSGYASIANDYDGHDTSCPGPDVPQRKQDLNEAKKLLAAAGQPHLKVSIVTDDAFPGMLATAQLLAQQASKIGVTITPKKIDTATLLSKWLDWPFVVNVSSSPYINMVPDHLLPTGQDNASHWNNKQFNDLAAKLALEPDPSKQCGLIAQLQKIQYEDGASIIPADMKNITPYSPKVHGLVDDLYARSAYMFGGVTIDK